MNICHENQLGKQKKPVAKAVWKLQYSYIKFILLQLKSPSIKTKEKPCIRLTQENFIKFLIQSVYLILVVYTTQNLTYPKDHALSIKLICSKHII